MRSGIARLRVLAAALQGLAFAGLLLGAGLGFAAAAGAAEDRKPDSRPATRKVTIDAASFQPANVVVNVGDTVVWTNNDLFKHTVTATEGAFDSKDIPAGGSWSYIVKAAGRFEYACIYHSTMRGALQVR
jgi:plastocyanin